MTTTLQHAALVCAVALFVLAGCETPPVAPPGTSVATKVTAAPNPATPGAPRER